MWHGISYFSLRHEKICFRPDFTSKLVHVLAFGTPKFYIAPYDKIKRELVNLSSNCDVKSGLKVYVSCLSVDQPVNMCILVMYICKSDLLFEKIAYAN